MENKIKDTGGAYENASKIAGTSEVGYIVTGTLKNGKRFKALHYDGGIGGKLAAYGINLWRGTVWAKLSNGSRKVLKRVWN